MPGDPRSGSKVGEAPDREIGKPGKNRGKVVAHRNFKPAAAFHDRDEKLIKKSNPGKNEAYGLDAGPDGSQALLVSALTRNMGVAERSAIRQMVLLKNLLMPSTRSTQGCQERRSAGRSWQCDGRLPW